ncbi:NUDIX hydrolase [Amycolatopsis sp. A1MSW2902]|uniref:NUDIX hydrolase n=1 Tax=Amycolatopsis sp. A1MSW2902 TaxID=687413 RepID=UPI00307DD119
MTIDIDAELVPDDTRWGQGYGRPYSPAELDDIARNIATPQPGYRFRLRANSPGWSPAVSGRAHVPPGYDALRHPNRDGVDPDALDPEFATQDDPVPAVAVEPGLQQYCRDRGWVLDQHGRPLHPLHLQLLADSRIGLPAGLGYAHWYGEAVVADAVVTTADGDVLLTGRETASGRIPCLPGGYAIPADAGRTAADWRHGLRPVTRDSVIAAAARKTRDETGVAVGKDTPATIVRAIRPISSPHTLHAWTCIYTVRFDLADTIGPPPDPATGARWASVDDLHERLLGRMWPDHRRAILAAVE